MLKQLYVGIDVHRKTHYAALLPTAKLKDNEGEWKKAQTLEFGNNRADFERLALLISSQAKATSDVSVAVDHTGGHYSEPVTYFLLSKGYDIWHLTASGIKAAKERFLGEENKTDKIDAATSAYLLYLRDLHGVSLHVSATNADLESKAALLRSMVLQRRQYGKLSVQARNRLHSFLHAIFPEGEEDHFRPLLKIIPSYPTPEDILKSDGLSGIRGVARQRRERIVELAGQTVGIPPITYRWLIRDLCRQINETEEKLKSLDATLQSEVESHEYGPILLSFPCVGAVCAATIIGATRDIHSWPNKKKFKKAMGVYGTVRQTGSRPSLYRTGRAGNALCKQALFMANLAGLRYQDQSDFRDYYLVQLRKGRKKMQALVRSMSKMAEIMYHCLRDGEAYVYRGTYRTREIRSPSTTETSGGSTDNVRKPKIEGECDKAEDSAPNDDLTDSV